MHRIFGLCVLKRWCGAIDLKLRHSWTLVLIVIFSLDGLMSRTRSGSKLHLAWVYKGHAVLYFRSLSAIVYREDFLLKLIPVDLNHLRSLLGIQLRLHESFEWGLGRNEGPTVGPKNIGYVHFGDLIHLLVDVSN